MPTSEQAQGRGFAATSVPITPVLQPRLLIDPPEPLLLRPPPRYHLGHAVRHSGLLGMPPIVYSEVDAVPTLQVVLYPRAAGVSLPGTPAALEVLVVQPIPASDQPLLVYGLRPSPLTDALVEQLRLMLRLDDDLGVFYRLTDQDPELRWVAACDGGRLLRAPTAFEDLVHCLALAYGSRTEAAAVIGRLCEQLGPRTSLGRHGFPGPQEIADAPAHKYAQIVGSAGAPGRSGRATSLGRTLRELAICCASGSLHPESLRRRPSELTPVLLLDDDAWQDALHEELEWQERVRALLETLPGYRRASIGPRAVEDMLLRLCCYDGVRLDSKARTAWEGRFPQRARAAGPKPPLRQNVRSVPRSLEERHAHGLLLARRIARRLSPFSIYRGLAQALLLRVPSTPRRPAQ
jgi:hypothetical protein